MIDVSVWIKEELEKRIAHIDADEPCIERGGNSTVHRGILAQYLNSNIVEKVDLCHYCGNGKCSNPKHLYWGTRKENIDDSVRHGTKRNGWSSLVERLGEDGAREHMRNIANPSKAGAANKGKVKSLEHRQKISASVAQLVDAQVSKT